MIHTRPVAVRSVSRRPSTGPRADIAGSLRVCCAVRVPCSWCISCWPARARCFICICRVASCPRKTSRSFRSWCSCRPAPRKRARSAVVEQAEAILETRAGGSERDECGRLELPGQRPERGPLCFVDLKDWSARNTDAATLRDTLNRSFSKIMDGDVSAQMPPSVPGMGHSEGFVMRLEDRGGIGIAALTSAREQLFEQARNNPAFADVHSEALPGRAAHRAGR